MNIQKISDFILGQFQKLQNTHPYPQEIVQEVIGDYSVDNLYKDFDAKNFIIKMNENDEIIGIFHHGIHSEKPQIALIYWIFVDEKYQGKGLAQEMFSSFIQGLDSTIIAIRSACLIGNTSSISMHRAFGFTERYRNGCEIFWEKPIISI